MENYYLFLVIVLFVLAISDLVVGVSNDAVNFLNSAVGSKVAPRFVIMTMASLGIFIGATFSSGMMEVARSGVFNPQFFSFDEVMVIFLAVMMTDIILLDLFNTFGLPTSTTVSIVFELLGAATVVAIIKVANEGGMLIDINQYLNWSKSIAIISGIFLSIGIAFTLGTLVQFVSRLMFGFRSERGMKYLGGIWGGVSLTAITYFLLIKGLKGASFVTAEVMSWVVDNTWLIVLGSMIIWSVLMQILMMVFKVNILRIIVLFGTFALAMAFAGNDLVNFIGVPIAGLESFGIWAKSGAPPEGLAMERLADPVQTPTYLLLMAGLIMVVTLWFSKKARSVTDTEVNLARQDEGAERFEPNNLSRAIVRLGVSLGRVLEFAVSPQFQRRIRLQFTQPVRQPDPDEPAFDLVRASVNLTMASILISFATSLKLPLSTTYVSFMVAMGTSLADRAWGRDSAVYRVAGVLNVVGGWFLTALIAFMVSGTICVLLYYFGGWAVGLVMVLIVALVIHTFRLHKKGLGKVAEDEEELAFATQMGGITRKAAGKAAHSLEEIQEVYTDVIKGLINEDRLVLRESMKQALELRNAYKRNRKKMLKTMAHLDPENGESQDMIRIQDMEKNLIRSLIVYTDAAFQHVENVFNPLRPEQVKKIEELEDKMGQFLSKVETNLQTYRFENNEEVFEMESELYRLIDSYIGVQVKGIKKSRYSSANSLLQFSFLMETQNLVSISTQFLRMYHQFSIKYPIRNTVSA